MPGSNHGPSIKNPRVYEALRKRRGMSKRRAAAISNAMVSKDSTTTDLAIPPTGPHALFNQPGVGIRSARRRKRLKGWDAKVGQTIIGDLVRGEGGRFSGGSGSSASRKPSARSDRAKQRQARADERRARYAAEDDQEQTTRAEEDAYIAAGATGRERQRRRAEIAAKRRERANARRARRAEDAVMEREQRGEEDAADAKAEEEAKPKGGGGGGGSKKKPTEEEKRADSDRKKAENRAKTAPQAGLSSAEAEFLAGAASGTLPLGSFDASKLRSLGLVVDTGDTTEATDAGRRALAALERGDVRDALAAIQDGKAQVARDQARREREQQPKKQPPSTRGGQKPDPRRSPGQLPPGQRPAPRSPVSTMPVRPEPNPKAERARNQDLAQRIIRNLEERRRRRPGNRGIGGITNVERSNRAQRKEAATFTVFKDAAGHDRWASITTTAYQDKDQEWISRKAIRSVVAAGDSGAPRGPLRYWHVPGLDLGDCDYQAALGDGRMLLESGTFRSKAAARIGAEAARRGYQMSPGFVHTRQEPRGGVFDNIALFERSFVPPGRASNPYTRLLTKERRMLTDEKRKEFETLAGDDEGRALLQQLISQADTTVKERDREGTVYKDAPPWAQALIARLDALEVTVKAPMAPASMMDAGATEEDDALAKMDADMGMGDAEPEGDEGMLDDAAFADLIVQKLMAAIGPMLELEKKMTGYLGEMKAMLQPQTAKDDARAKEIADLQARLKSLEGDQPRAARAASWNAQTWEAIAGAGIPVTKEQAVALATQQANQPPAGLSSPIEIAAHKALWGDS